MRKTKPSLQVDTREKNPWSFLGDPDFEEVIHEKLDAGDYSLVTPSGLIIIERKSGADELFVNFSSAENKARFYREAEKLLNYKHRFLIIEQTLDEVSNPNSYYINKLPKKTNTSQYMPVAVVMENLTHLMIHYNMHVIFAGRRAQSLAKKIILKAYKDGIDQIQK